METVSNGFSALPVGPVKTVSEKLECRSTGLKPGVNETTLE